MWSFWILLCVVSFTASCVKAEKKKVEFGKELSMKLPNQAAKLLFISVDGLQYAVWTNGSNPVKGKVEGWGYNRRFIINNVNFHDQGNYFLRDFRNSVISTMTLEVFKSTVTENCIAGKILSISLNGLRKDEATLHFSTKNLKLVQRGSPVKNLPEYFQRLQVTNSSIQLLSIREADVGKYILLDGQDHEVRVVTLKHTEFCAYRIEDVKVNHGHQLKIKLPVQVDSLEFTSVNKSQNYTIWSDGVQPQRGAVEGWFDDRRFVINAVNFDDPGNYTQRNHWGKISSVTRVNVVASTDSETHEAGETLIISLSGLKKDEASLRFSNKNDNLKLVERGSLKGSLPEYFQQIEVTSSNIHVHNVSAMNEGKYMLLDVKGREAKVINFKLRGPINWLMVGIAVVVLVLISIVAAACSCCRKISQVTSYVQLDEVAVN